VGLTIAASALKRSCLLLGRYERRTNSSSLAMLAAMFNDAKVWVSALKSYSPIPSRPCQPVGKSHPIIFIAPLATSSGSRFAKHSAIS